MAKTKFITNICSMYVAITPDQDGHLAIPRGGDKEEYGHVADQISEAVEKADSDIKCENALYHSLSFVFLVNIRENETPADAKARVSKAFKTAWDSLVVSVEKGRSLSE